MARHLVSGFCYTDLTISEIAYRINFRNVSYFIRFYRRSAGVEPGSSRGVQVFNLLRSGSGDNERRSGLLRGLALGGASHQAAVLLLASASPTISLFSCDLSTCGLLCGFQHPSKFWPLAPATGQQNEQLFYLDLTPPSPSPSQLRPHDYLRLPLAEHSGFGTSPHVSPGRSCC
jgi:hypothetical protein